MKQTCFGVAMGLFLLAGCGENTNDPLAGDIETVTIESNATTMYATAEIQMHATAGYSHGISDRNVTENVRWQESNNTIAFVNSVGRVSGREFGGDVTISGSYNRFGGSVTLKVIALSAAVVNTDETNLSTEQTVLLSATGIFEDGHRRDITDAVFWQLGSVGDSNATLEQNGTLYTGDANGTLDINISRYDVNASLQLLVRP